MTDEWAVVGDYRDGTCTSCEKPRRVRRVPDPYQAEVHEEDVYGDWCDGCYDEREQEV